MKKIIFALCAFLGLQTAASAQLFKGIADKEDLEKVKARTMIVVLREEDPKLSAKMKNPKELADYKKAIVAYNEKIQRIAPKFWTLSKDVVIKTESELKAMQKDKSITKAKEYAYLEYKNELIEEKTYANNKPGMPGYNPGLKGEMARFVKTGEHWYTPAIEIRFIEEPNDGPSGYATMLSANPSDLQLALAVKHLVYLYNTVKKQEESPNGKSRKEQKSEMQENISENLKSKTLLIDQKILTPGITDVTIKNLYPHPFQITDEATITKAVMESTEGIALVNIVPVLGFPTFYQNVTDTNGEVINAVLPTSLPGKTSILKVTKESLALYDKSAADAKQGSIKVKAGNPKTGSVKLK